ncbi:hypothetical protein WOSG25_140260 [Weissella oryzae SG25]|uniref:DUF4870 domain-containing protein n=1 Tax=Weissella oryzae (strain DSM 25784 / JCM 18191 / LMG 30913 / SG25) TaxID=1329250 RepID=A0A069CW82_WEIOS|nr:DUF4870 domain-containing protein [Weissella oryzae]GAK31724.1 hypothetical protein WOSG25_140260 [Weissella oryzae SG25]
MKANRLVSAIAYLSVLIAPVLVALIIWVIADKPDVRANAKKAFWIQIPPFLFIILILILIGVIGLATNSAQITGLTTLIFFAIFALISVILYIYSIVLGIKQLLNAE